MNEILIVDGDNEMSAVVEPDMKSPDISPAHEVWV